MIERGIKTAKFPATKRRDSFDFMAIPSLDKALTMELARCEFIDRRENVIALGPSGTGNTHLAPGLGLAACQKGRKVGFATAAALVHELMEAVDDRRLQRLQKTLAVTVRSDRLPGRSRCGSRQLLSGQLVAATISTGRKRASSDGG